MALEPVHTDFLLVQSADIRAALFELTHPESHILVRDLADREVAVVLLGIDKQTGFFFWRPRDYAGTHFARHANGDIFTGTVFHFAATGYGGVRMHFRVPRPEIVTFDDGSATYVSPLPERMSRVQRRKIFRASLQGCTVKCTASYAAGSGTPALQFSVRDISIEGIGLRSSAPVTELPARGRVMRGVTLQFGEFGALNVDLDVRNTYPISGQCPALDGGDACDSHRIGDIEAGLFPKNNAIGAATMDAPAGNEEDLGLRPPSGEIESHLGALIVGLPARDQVWLQQMVWRLEKMRGARPD